MRKPRRPASHPDAPSIQIDPRVSAAMSTAERWHWHRDPAQADRFLDALDAALRLVPDAVASIARGGRRTRRLPLAGFPYYLVCRLRKGTAYVSAFHSVPEAGS